MLCTRGSKVVYVFVNSVTDELLTDTWGLCAKFGRFVEIRKDAFQNNHLQMRPFDSNVTLSAVDRRELYKHRPEEVKEIFSEVINPLQRGVIISIKPEVVLTISQFGCALRKLRSGENMGKVIVTLGKNEKF